MKNQKNKQKLPPSFIINAIGRFNKLLQRISTKLTPPSVKILDMVQGFWVAKSIGTASSLGIADLLENKPTSVRELAKQTNTNEEFLYRLLRMLAGIGIFKEIKNKSFINTPLSCTLLAQSDSMKYMVEHQVNPNNWNFFGAMEQSLHQGKSASQIVLGESIFEHLGKHPKMNELYNNAMTNSSMMVAMVVCKAYSFKKSTKLVDVGGGHGTLLKQIILHNRHLKGIVFDLPHVVEDAQNKENTQLKEQLSFIAGSVFDVVPNADAYLLKSLLHAFNDEHCIKILNNINKSADKGAKILIVEPLIGQPNQPSFGKLFDVQLMMSTEGGRERTKQEYKKLIAVSGLSFSRFISTISPFTIIEAIKNE